jgi:transcription antitermination factor NusG
MIYIGSLPDSWRPENPWFAIRVRSSFETKVADALRGRDVPVYLPTYVERRQWSDRIKEHQLALFPGYLFSQVTSQNWRTILQAGGILGIAGQGERPEPVPSAEMDSIRRLAEAGQTPRAWPYLRKGERVRVIKGALEGLEGFLIREKSEFRLVLSVDLLQQSAAVEIDRGSVRAVRATHNVRSVLLAATK